MKTEHLDALIKMAARRDYRQRPGDIRPGVATSMGFSQFLPEAAQANPLFSMGADLAP